MEKVSDALVDGHRIERHGPELYAYDRIAEPLGGFDQVRKRHIEQFRREGFLAIEKAFTARQTVHLLESLLGLIAGRNPGFKQIQFEARVADRLGQLTNEQREDAVRKLSSFVEYEPSLRAMAEHPELLSLLRKLLKSDHPKLFQDTALFKPPRIGREKPWHQDCAYFDLALGTPVVGVWIALDDSTLENGCMHALAGAHLHGPVVHFQRRDWQICDTDIHTMHGPKQPIVAIPLRAGGCLVFDGLLPHGTPHNDSDQRRRAIQFHYCPADAVRTDKSSRMAVFGSEGEDVTC